MSATQSKPDFTAAMKRLREIATQSHDNALTEGPVNADRLLLDLCADALHSLKHAEKANAARDWAHLGAATAAEKAAGWARHEALFADYRTGIASAKPKLIRIRKMKATTAAGIYAKAAVVRASKTGAADLAMSLAEDLLAAPGLRAALWPAEGGE